jgi:hypothetical protein
MVGAVIRRIDQHIIRHELHFTGDVRPRSRFHCTFPPRSGASPRADSRALLTTRLQFYPERCTFIRPRSPDREKQRLAHLASEFRTPALVLLAHGLQHLS